MKTMIALSVVAVLETLALGTTAACRRRIFPCAGGDEMGMVVQHREAARMHHRETVTNALRAGFELVRDENPYLDVVKAIEARRPS